MPLRSNILDETRDIGGTPGRRTQNEIRREQPRRAEAISTVKTLREARKHFRHSLPVGKDDRATANGACERQYFGTNGSAVVSSVHVTKHVRHCALAVAVPREPEEPVAAFFARDERGGDELVCGVCEHARIDFAR